MKKMVFVVSFVFLAVSMYAQVQGRGTVVQISNPDYPGADPALCVFGDSIEAVTLTDVELAREILFARERMSVTDDDSFLNPAVRREWGRLNTRYVSVHIVQRRLTNDERIFATYYIVEIYERAGNNFYLIATNDFN